MKRTALIVAVALAMPPFVEASNNKPHSLEFLNFGIGARAVAMGSAFTGLSNDLNAVQWNPAGLSETESIAFDTHYNSLFEDMSYSGVTLALPSWFSTTFGFSYYLLNSGSISKTSASNRGLFLSDDGSFTVKDSLMVATIANRSFKYVELGANLKRASESIDNASASTMLYDIGIILNVLPQLRIGATMRNQGGDVKFIDAEDKINGSTSVGVTVRPWRNMFLTSDIKKVRGYDSEIDYGGEYVIGKNVTAAWVRKKNEETPEPTVVPLLALRAGLRTNVSDAGDETSQLTFGAGFFIKRFHLDYAFSDYGELGPTHQFTAGFSFGKNPWTDLTDWSHRKPADKKEIVDNSDKSKESKEKEGWMKNRRRTSTGRYKID